jgi:hypothetical protein
MSSCNIEVVELTPFEKAKKEYIQAIRQGCKGKLTLRQVDEAWFAYNSLREDGFGKKLRELGSLDAWKESFKSL